MDARKRPQAWRRLGPLWDAVLLETAISGGGSARPEHLVVALLIDPEVGALLPEARRPEHQLRSALIGEQPHSSDSGIRKMDAGAWSVLDDELLAFVESAVTGESAGPNSKVALLRKCLALPEIGARLATIGLDALVLADRLATKR
jgi:hypothetical protein